MIDAYLIIGIAVAFLIGFLIIAFFGSSLQAKPARPAASKPPSSTTTTSTNNRSTNNNAKAATKGGNKGGKRSRQELQGSSDKAASVASPTPSAPKKSKTEKQPQKQEAAPSPAAAVVSDSDAAAQAKKKKKRKSKGKAATTNATATTTTATNSLADLSEDDIQFAESLSSRAKNPSKKQAEKEKAKEEPAKPAVDTSNWATNDKKTKEIASLKSRLALIEQEREELSKVVEDHKKKLRDVSLTNAKLTNKMEELKESYEAKLQRYEAARANNEDLPNEVDLKEKNYVQEGHETKIFNLSKELGIQTQTNLRMMKTIDALNATVSRLEHERNTILTKGAKGISAKLQRELVEKTKALEAQIAENQKLRASLNNVGGGAAGDADSESADAKISALQLKVESLAGRNELLEKELQDKERESRDALTKFQEAQSELERMKEQFSTVGGVVEVGDE
ncbi:hypothetical protein QOT17_013889 [Balamuthia mandrillaris]